MSEAAIQVEHLSKVYQIAHKGNRPDTFRDAITGILKRKTGSAQNPTTESFHALKDISFEVNQGEVLGIIGRNGAGKSTLLKILSRITDPTSGRIALKGRVASLLEVGTGFHPELTGRENIYLNGSILGMTRAEIRKKFDEIVDFSGVEKFLDTPVKRYSSGMYVRLAFAVASHLEPEILVIDEVLAVGDAEFQKKCLGRMNQIAGTGKPILYVSHQLPSVKMLCQSALWLESGEVYKFGNAPDIVDNYLGRNDVIETAHENCSISSLGLPLGKVSHHFESEDHTSLDAYINAEIHSKKTVPNLAFGFELSTLEGTCISRPWPKMIHSVTKNDQSHFEVQFKLENISSRLATGSYQFQLLVSEPFTKPEYAFGSLINIELTDQDPYQTGDPFLKETHGLTPLPTVFSKKVL